MNCRYFEKYELGKLKAELFRNHAKSCSICEEKVLLDREMLQMASSMKGKVEAPHLWAMIEKDLKNLQREGSLGKRVRIFRNHALMVPSASVLFIALCLGFYLLIKPGLLDTSLLRNAALRRVERKELRYEKSIEKLQHRILPQLPELGLEMMLLYRDRMETIDTQISACREALVENPGNTHIRRYMLAAFQDKKETLREIREMGIKLNQEEDFR